ncbi:MAG: polysaccharide biosynthesis C-terminal domain-containing protein [Ignavibacteria bacterium]|nr:polysaccharide biosynthesis C-terminal domain-containing protein [Ignavibacteria bacterium]
MSDRSPMRLLLSQTAIYGLGIMLNRSVGFILLPVYTGWFAPSELGMFMLVQSLSVFLGFVYMLGMETAFMKKFIDAKSESEKANVYSSSIIFLLISSIAFSGILYLSASTVSDMLGLEDHSRGVFLVKVMSAVMIADTVYRIPMLYFRAQLKARTYSILNLLSFAVNVSMNILLIAVMKLGVEAIFYSYIVSVAVVIIPALFMTRRFLRLRIDIRKTAELLSYGFKFIFIGVFILVIDVSDRFFLQHFYDESIVGIYSANYRLASVMGLVISAFRFAWTPFFLSLDNENEAKNMMPEVVSKFVIIGCAMMLAFGLLTDLLAPVSVFGLSFLNERYLSGIGIVPVVILSYFFSGLYAVFNAAPFITENTRSLLLISGIGFAVNILLNFVLIPPMGMMGAAAATLLTYIAMSAMIISYSQKISRIRLDRSRLAYTAIACLAMFLAGYFGVNRSGLALPFKLGIDLAIISLFVMLAAKTGAFRRQQV